MSIAVQSIVFIVATYWFRQGIVVYKFWSKNLPGNGFVPVLFSGVLMILSAGLLVAEVRRKLVASQNKDVDTVKSKDLSWLRALAPVGYAIAAIIAFRWLGVVISMFLTAFIWLVAISKERMVKSIIISTIVTLAIYLIFVLWLRVPFPRGIFGM